MLNFSLLPDLGDLFPEDIYYNFQVNYGPHKGLVVDVTTINNKRAIIFHRPEEFTKVYYPSDIKVSFKDYDTDGKYMITILCPNFWVYHEKVPGISEFVNFGTNMEMPFLLQQNFKDL